MADPTLTGLSSSITLTPAELAAGHLLDTDVTFGDGDADLNGGKLIVTGLLAQDQVTIHDEGAGLGNITLVGHTVSYGGVPIGTFTGGIGTPLVVTFSALATPDAVDALIENLSYKNTSATPTDRTLHIDVLDAAGNSIGLVDHVSDSFTEMAGLDNPLGGVSVAGQSGAPGSFFDVDGDGRADLVLGTEDGQVRYFHNEATGFVEKTGADNPFDDVSDGILVAQRYASPTFVDLNGDGRADLVVGQQDGTLRVFGNNGDGTFTEQTRLGNPDGAADVGLFSKPAFGDVDRDGDMDLVVGDGDGKIAYFRNDAGTFNAVTIGSPFGSINLSDLAGGDSAPAFVDIDGDGDLDLVAGSAHFGIQLYKNNGGTFTASGLAFGSAFSGYPEYETAPTFVDIDGDGDLDAVVASFTDADGPSLRTLENTTGPRGQAITIHVGSPNAAPVATDDSKSGSEDDATIGGTLAATDTDLDGLTYELVPNSVKVNGSAASDGLVTVSSDGTWSYSTSGDQDLNTGETRTVTFDFVANDGTVDSNVATVTITINGLNEQVTLDGTPDPDVIDASLLTPTHRTDYTINGKESADKLTGNVGDDKLNGQDGDDELDGGVGEDVMTGGGGDDLYHVDHFDDAVVEAANGGTDTVTSSVNHRLADNVEKLVLTGSASVGKGNAGDNTITGAGAGDKLYGYGGKDRLDGGVGADRLYGGADDDTYVVDNADDRPTEAADEGYDTVESSVSFTLQGNLEKLVLTGTAHRGKGNTLDNLIEGNGSANRLQGFEGDDELHGMGGNDLVEGGAGADDVCGDGGNDVLHGGAGIDTMRGGMGDDIFYVDDTSETVVENGSEGYDVVFSSATFTLSANVEELILTGTAANGTGNGDANRIYGTASGNILDGAGGADKLYGGDGDDTYMIDDAGDRVTEELNEGTDTVMSSISYTLSANLETLLLTGTASGGKGNELDNTIHGNAVANTIKGYGGADSVYGGLGNDQLYGGAGADRFYFDTVLDAANNVDKLADFSVADDTIMLDRNVFAGLADGVLGAGAFALGTAAGDADDRIVYDSATGNIFYDADGSDVGQAVLFAQVAAGTALTEADFAVYTGV
jgi:VCBS repeat-containing protein